MRGEVRVFDIEKQEALLLHSEHKGSVHSCIWTASVVTSAGSDGQLIHTDLRSPALVNKFKAHFDEITKLVSCSETFATSSKDKSIKIWKGFDKYAVSSFCSLKAHVHAMTWTGERGLEGFSGFSGLSGKPALIFGDNDKKLNVLNFNESQGKFEELATFPEKITSLKFISDGSQLLTGFEDGSLSLWSYPSMTCLGKSSGHEGSLRFLCLSPDETCAVSGGDDETLRFWQFSSVKKREETVFLVDFR
jgi:WD40 repeat protein